MVLQVQMVLAVVVAVALLAFCLLVQAVTVLLLLPMLV
jgi:hypothetical protein